MLRKQGKMYTFSGNRGAICNMHHWLRGMDAPFPIQSRFRPRPSNKLSSAVGETENMYRLGSASKLGEALRDTSTVYTQRREITNQTSHRRQFRGLGGATPDFWMGMVGCPTVHEIL